MKIYSLIFLLLFGVSHLFGDETVLRNNTVTSWPRLKIDYPHWDRHKGGDLSVIRQLDRSINSGSNEPQHKVARIENLKEMCSYPFLFTCSTRHIKKTEFRNNLKEYMIRGGFLFIEECGNPSLFPNVDSILEDEIKSITEILPNSRIERLQNGHEIFHCYYNLSEGFPILVNPKARANRHGLYAIYYHDRIVGAISTGALHCAWPFGSQEVANEALKMAVNIYVYAMTN